jgi:uncharacterized SAM-binding protein YcdF (DUF218 family)
MRKSYIQLPSIKELEVTLATESKRPVPPAKASRHYASLGPFIKFLDVLGIETSQITLGKSWQEVRKLSEIILDEVIRIIPSLNFSQIAKPSIELYRYLSEEDIPQKSDLIIAFGAKTTARLEKALELFKKEMALKLLFTGGVPLYGDGEPEANFYYRVAIRGGVREEDIILENKSITLADNVRSSLNLLDKINFHYKKIILITSPYAQRRSFGMMMKYTPLDTIVFRANSSTRKGLRENDWFTNEEGIRYVLGEFYKIWFGLVINTI